MRWIRRVAGLLRVRMAELKLGRLADPRARRGRRWQLTQLLQVVLVGIMSGARSLADVEHFSADVSGAARRLIGIGRSVADTTLRDMLAKLDPMVLRPALHRLVQAAHRRHALVPVGLPFGVASMDGKVTAITDGNSPYAQRQTTDGGLPYWLLRTVTSVLVSTPARPCIDVMPIPQHTNERGIFAKAFGELVRVCGHMFRVVTYDAGATCAANAALVVKAGKDYLFAVKADMGHMFKLIGELLAVKPVVAVDVHVQSKDVDIVRTLTLMNVFDHGRYRHNQLWPSCRTILRVDTWEVTPQKATRVMQRYFATSLERDVLTKAQWLDLVRRHWGVECVHNTLDTALLEDDKPFTPGCATAALAVMVLRRIAYTCLALFRDATRSEAHRERPWRRLLVHMRDALVAMTDAALDGLRLRKDLRVCG